MCTQKLSHPLVKVAVFFLFLFGCSAPVGAPVPATEIPATLTPVHPTEIPATPTPISPTEIPATSTPVPATESPPTPTAPVLITSAEMLIGNWQPLSTSQDAMFMQINSDGTCHQSYSLDRLNDIPEIECSYAFEGNDLVFTVIKLNGVPECPSPTAKYKVRLLAVDQIELVATEDNCTPRIRSTRGVYQRIP